MWGGGKGGKMFGKTTLIMTIVDSAFHQFSRKWCEKECASGQTRMCCFLFSSAVTVIFTSAVLQCHPCGSWAEILQYYREKCNLTTLLLLNYTLRSPLAPAYTPTHIHKHTNNYSILPSDYILPLHLFSYLLWLLRKRPFVINERKKSHVSVGEGHERMTEISSSAVKLLLTRSISSAPIACKSQ